jgi:hypothetical protein
MEIVLPGFAEKKPRQVFLKKHQGKHVKRRFCAVQWRGIVALGLEFHK